jgi:hypothetical protein
MEGKQAETAAGASEEVATRKRALVMGIPITHRHEPQKICLIHIQKLVRIQQRVAEIDGGFVGITVMERPLALEEAHSCKLVFTRRASPGLAIRLRNERAVVAAGSS